VVLHPPPLIHSRDDLDSIGNLVGHVRDFANGAIRIAQVSTEEPVAAPDHLLIFVATESMGDECFAVSAASYNSDYQGFYSLNVPKTRAFHDAQKGLLLRVRSAYLTQTGVGKSAGDIKVRINRKNGNSVTIEK